VAARRALSANTVGVHVRKIYRKLGVHSRVELSDALHRRRA
jgi:DNA-binding NarL/FixJ family response regulator